MLVKGRRMCMMMKHEVERLNETGYQRHCEERSDEAIPLRSISGYNLTSAITLGFY